MKKHITSFLATAALALSLCAASVASAAEVGKPAPAFTLTDVNGKSHNLADFKGKYVVLEWFNHSCPFVVKHYDSKNMQNLQEKYTAKDVIWLSINSTNPEHENYTDAAKAKELNAQKGGNATAVLLDPDGRVGKAYDAKTTPHMFVIDPQGTLVYNGAIDDKSGKDMDASAKNYVSAALDAALAGQAVPEPRTKPYGCSVKYAAK